MTDATAYIYAWPDAPPAPDELVAGLRTAQLLPDNSSWWFAWNELELVLPRLLAPDAQLAGDWSALHVFSPQVELRYTRRGGTHRAALLTEIAPANLAGWASPDRYHWQSGWRLLAGARMRLPGGEGRGVVAFPRPLDYGVPESDERASTLVAQVRRYYDDQARLRATRYLRLDYESTGVTPRVESLRGARSRP
jgi:hypothetical protein